MICGAMSFNVELVWNSNHTIEMYLSTNMMTTASKEPIDAMHLSKKKKKIVLMNALQMAILSSNLAHSTN